MFFVAGCSRAPEGAASGASGSAVLTENGVGSIRIGVSRNELLTQGGAVISGDASCEMVRPQGAPQGVFAMLVDGRIVRLDVTTPGVVTATGVGVGTSEEQLHKAYPWIREQLSKYVPNGHDFVADVVDGPYSGRRFVFESDGTKVIRYRVGPRPQVDWVEGCS